MLVVEGTLGLQPGAAGKGRTSCPSGHPESRGDSLDGVSVMGNPMLDQS